MHFVSILAKTIYLIDMLLNANYYIQILKSSFCLLYLYNEI